MTKRATRSVVAALVGLSLVAAACGGDDDDSTDSTEAPAAGSEAPSTEAPTDGTDAAPATEAPTDGTEAPTDGTAPPATPAGDIDLGDFATDEFSGEEVVIMSTFDGVEGDRYNAAWADFEAATGITIVHENTNTLEDDVKIRAEGGDAPDLAILPQPGLLATLARSDLLHPLENLLADVEANDVAGFANYGTVDGTFYAPPFGAGIKSIVWYSPSRFAEAGYEVPETWGDLIALSDQMVADGKTPWCFGIESGGATGWPVTDWVEELMLRTTTPEVYDQWVAHEIPFNSPEVIAAFDAAAEIIKNEDYILNGVESIPAVDHAQAGLPIVDGQCELFQHPNWWASNLPEGTTIGPDGDFNIFFEPMQNADDPKAVLGGGEFIAAFNDRPVVEFVAKYLTSAEYANSRMAQGGWISPNTQADLSYIPAEDQLTRTVAEFLVTADVFRFDASDLMPSEIGAGEFWTEGVDWILSEVTTEEATQNIEDAWNALG